MTGPSLASAALPSAPAVAEAQAACAHCGQAAIAGQRFCCTGCAAAFDLVNALGFGAFYARRVESGVGRPLQPADADHDFREYAKPAADGACTLDLLVDGLHCGACVWLVEGVLRNDKRVLAGRVNLSTRRLHLRWRGDRGLANEIAGQVVRLGFRLAPFDAAIAARTQSDDERELIKALAVAGFAAANVMLLSVSVWAGHAGQMGPATRDLMHWLSAFIVLPAIAYAGLPFFRSAIGALAHGRTNMDVPISIGVILACAMSLFETVRSGPDAYFDSAITLLFFLLIGRFLDRRARGQARQTAAHLAALALRDVAVLQEDGTTARRSPTTVTPGTHILTASGERIGVDGRVVSGRSAVDQSLVTGESTPVSVGAGDQVYAGAVNLEAPLVIEAAASADRTLLAEIVRLTEAAENGRGRYVVLADRVARAYAPVVHVTAALTLAGWIIAGAAWQTALLYAIAVLIITCPCALALAIPAVQVAATGRLMRRGVLLKSATALERLAAIDTVVFDKTGTLTQGRPALLNADETPDAALRAAARLAKASRHPLARALAERYPAEPAASGAEEVPGGGMRLATGAGELRLGSRSFCGVSADSSQDHDGPELWCRDAQGGHHHLRFGDVVRTDARATLAALHARRRRLVMLSGDRPKAVAAVAAQLGIADAQAAADPAAKALRLAGLRADGRTVLMVGDGINDAPSLAAAHVSMSPASAADIAQNAADIVFSGDRLAPVVEAIDTADRAARLARQNLGFALAYNLAAVPLAIAGLVSPLLAALAMSTSSIVVVLNAIRVGR
jgi:Cu2+-exporting ATPase